MLEVNPSPVRRRAGEPSDMEEVFEIFFGSHGRANRAIKMEGGIGFRPATDVYETADEFIIQVDLAGMRQEEIEVLVDAEHVVIKGVRSNIAPSGKKHFHKMEIMVGPFERHIRIPPNVDPGSASAHYASGFLFVRMRRGKSHIDESRIITIES